MIRPHPQPQDHVPHYGARRVGQDARGSAFDDEVVRGGVRVRNHCAVAVEFVGVHGAGTAVGAVGGETCLDQKEEEGSEGGAIVHDQSSFDEE
jgi:hypothetical protein